MSRYESNLANQIFGIFERRISSTGLSIFPVVDEKMFDNVRVSLNVDGRAKKVSTRGRREVFAGIDVDEEYGRYQMMAVFDDTQPVSVFTLGVEPKNLIMERGYVSVGGGINNRKSFADVYGWLPEFMIVPAYTEALPDYRNVLAIPGVRSMIDSIELLGNNVRNGVVELVAQGNGKEIGISRDESKNIVRVAKIFGLQQLPEVGATPSLGPVFFRRIK